MESQNTSWISGPGRKGRVRKQSTPSRITIPTRANPLAKLVFAEMSRQRVTYFDLEMASGVLTSTVKAWRRDNAPGLASISAALGALGWALVPVPNLNDVPDQVREALDQFGEHFFSDEQAFGAAIRAAAEFPPHARRKFQTPKMDIAA